MALVYTSLVKTSFIFVSEKCKNSGIRFLWLGITADIGISTDQ